MKKNGIDLADAVKAFFDSVLQKMEETTEQMNTSWELEYLRNAQRAVKAISAEPEKWLKIMFARSEEQGKKSPEKINEYKEAEKYKEYIKGLSMYRNANGSHNIMFYVTVEDVLSALARYYEIPSSAAFRHLLENSLSDYYREMESSVFRRVVYNMMSDVRVIDKVLQQQRLR